MSRAWEIVTICCVSAAFAACYSPDITPCQVTCEESGKCPEGTSCNDGVCLAPGESLSNCAVDGGTNSGADGGVPLGMAPIPGTTFIMGCDLPDTNCPDDETPAHPVTLDAYFIDKLEVRAADYELCVTTGPCVEITDVAEYQPSVFPDRPVTGVNRPMAALYCDWDDKKRLPTEAEWENAARGEDANNIYPWGSEEPSCTLAEFSSCSGDPTKVDSLPGGASDYGLRHMSGNVWEWVSDWNSDYTTEHAMNPTGPLTPPTNSYGILRGGGWASTAPSLRVSARIDRSFTSSAYTYGMRCAKKDLR